MTACTSTRGIWSIFTTVRRSRWNWPITDPSAEEDLPARGAGRDVTLVIVGRDRPVRLDLGLRWGKRLRLWFGCWRLRDLSPAREIVGTRLGLTLLLRVPPRSAPALGFLGRRCHGQTGGRSGGLFVGEGDLKALSRSEGRGFRTPVRGKGCRPRRRTVDPHERRRAWSVVLGHDRGLFARRRVVVDVDQRAAGVGFRALGGGHAVWLKNVTEGR